MVTDTSDPRGARRLGANGDTLRPQTERYAGRGQKHPEARYARYRADCYEEAKGLCRSALNKFEYLEDRLGQARAVGLLGICHKALGDTDTAERKYLRQIELSRSEEPRTDDEAREEAAARGNLGPLYRDAGRHADVIHEIETSHEKYTRLNDCLKAAGARANLGTVYHEQGDYDAAEREHLAYRDVARELGDRYSECRALGNLGNVSRARGDHEKSLSYYQESWTMARGLGSFLNEGMGLARVGGARMRLGETDAGLELHRRGLEMVRSAKYPTFEAWLLIERASLLRRESSPEEALECAEAALDLCGNLVFLRGKADALWKASLALADTCEHPAAVERAREVLEIYEGLDSTKKSELRGRANRRVANASTGSETAV